MINQNKTEIAIWLRTIIRPQRLQLNCINMCAACFIVRPGTVFFCFVVFTQKQLMFLFSNAAVHEFISAFARSLGHV